MKFFDMFFKQNETQPEIIRKEDIVALVVKYTKGSMFENQIKLSKPLQKQLWKCTPSICN